MTYRSKVSRGGILSARTELATLLKEEHCDTTSSQKVVAAFRELADDIEIDSAPDEFARVFVNALKLPPMSDRPTVALELRRFSDDLASCKYPKDARLEGLAEILNRIYVTLAVPYCKRYLATE